MNNTEKILLSFLSQKLTDEQLNTINTIKESTDKALVEILSDFLSEDDFIGSCAELFRKNKINIDEICKDLELDAKIFLKFVSKIYKIEFFNLDNIDLDYRIAERVNMAQLKRFDALPIKEDEISVYVAFKNPFDIIAQDSIQSLFNRKLLKIVLADPSQIKRYINKLELNESIKDIIADIRKELSSSANSTTNENSGILKLIEVILKTAIQQRASDIHIEPTETNCIVRSRIDGMLSETFIFDKDIYPPMVSRLKLLSNMDIAERRKPQDGRFSAQILEREYDFRISTLPIINGESIVLRVLDKSKVIVSLENLSMNEGDLTKFQNAMKAPYGIVLVTGPTGSGKTTTLYAGLNEIKNIKTKIITVEDPVEYQLNLIQQVNVNEKTGLSFANALRSILRQDPDIIMIGEIRDTETLRIAIQAALTGHLVFSTLHTNDAISALPRIADMGIEPYLISGALIAIEAQRLVRKLCPHCKQKISLPKTTMQNLEPYLGTQYQFYTAVGCEQCFRTGYLGREMISEILPITNSVQTLVANRASKDEIREVAVKEGFKDIFTDGVLKAACGITSIEEVYRVAKI
ncbi:GspE/PulE family protein [Campylobacter mucosalis]|uniref:GspE/PulE family protein n=1 Tax=Campylobacter mucosalis TaxID=202 RepID=UPI00146FCCFF|nr:GspE/PulE family protein [Campylobacter mucosalis]